MDVNPMDQALEEHAVSGVEVLITLRDGSIIQGKVKDYDNYVILFDGTPQTVLYRHAILKLGGARPVMPERPASRPDADARPPTQKRRQERPQEKPAFKGSAESHGQLGTMGEAMLKWLKSQKGGG